MVSALMRTLFASIATLLLLGHLSAPGAMTGTDTGFLPAAHAQDDGGDDGGDGGEEEEEEGAAGPPSIIREGIDGCDFQTGRLSADCIPNFIAAVVVFVYGLIGVFFLLNILYAGYQIAFAGAGIVDEGAGKQRLKWAIIGFIVTVCSFLILDAIISVFTQPFTAAP